MKNIFSALVLFVFCAPLCAQETIQYGLVREQNSKRRPLGGVQIVFDEAVPTVSDDSGRFRLVFRNKKPGELIFIAEIRKNGYELVNAKELELLKISSTDRLGVDIILAPAGQLEQAKKEYYEVSDRALLAGFQRKKRELETQIQNAAISQQEFLDRFEILREQYERQKNALDALAEKFAKVNFDDVSAVYKEALELFKAGHVEEAIAKLEAAGFLDRSEKHLFERGRIALAEADISAQQAENDRGIQADIEATLQKARMHVQKGQLAEAALHYEQVSLADSANLPLLLECADFFDRNHIPEKALALYPLIIEHPQTQEAQKLHAIRRINALQIKKY